MGIRLLGVSSRCQHAQGVVRGFQGPVDIGLGMGEADASLFSDDREMVDAALNQRPAVAQIECRIVMLEHAPPIAWFLPGKINAARTADAGNERGNSVPLKQLALARFEARGESLEFPVDVEPRIHELLEA